MRLDHVALQVLDIEKALAFYVGGLGLDLISRNTNDAQQEEYVFLRMDGGSLELIRHTGDSRQPQALLPPYCPHVAIRTDDMGESLALIRDRNLPLVAGPFEIPGEETWVYLRDPDNNVIEFIQWLR
jgi:catechol 2,3-dioxygenase-like lactoylglutathione lyase family enzyme